MFIRRTKTRTTASGEHYYSYRIVDTYRVGEHVRQRNLLNLGSGFHVPQEQWSALGIWHLLKYQKHAKARHSDINIL